jgi:hypothetical protein
MEGEDPRETGGSPPVRERSVPGSRTRGLRPLAWFLLAAAIGAGGAWVGLLAVGGQGITAGPFHVRVSARFGAGKTIVALPPLGELSADTHSAPLTVGATLEGVNVARLVDGLRNSGAEAVAAETERAVRHDIGPFALRAFLVAVGAALLLAALMFRQRRRRVLVAVLAAALLTGGSEVGTAITYRPEAFRTPTYSGTISLAPQLVGPAKEVLGRIDDFRAQLVGVVNAAVRVYTSVGPAVLPQQDQIRILHVSDIHLSPLGMSFALQLAQTFDVDLVIDTGDLTSYGSPAENLIVSSIASFGRPYVLVRGNHDSAATEAAVRAIPNAAVLDGRARRIGGLLVYGLGDPVFTPNVAAAVDDATGGPSSVGTFDPGRPLEAGGRSQSTPRRKGGSHALRSDLPCLPSGGSRRCPGRPSDPRWSGHERLLGAARVHRRRGWTQPERRAGLGAGRVPLRDAVGQPRRG